MIVRQCVEMMKEGRYLRKKNDERKKKISFSDRALRLT
jgi:hypothetical protein